MHIKPTIVAVLFAVLTAFIAVPQAYSQTPATAEQCQVVTRSGSVAEDTDVNLDARDKPRDHDDNDFDPRADLTHGLVDADGPTDDRAPQFSTLFGPTPVFTPTIKNIYQLNLNDGKTPIPYDLASNKGVTQIEFGFSSSVLAPKLDYDLGGDIYHYVVLYADPINGTLTLKGTPEDNAVSGYTIHFTGLDINPAILAKYNESNSDPINRKQLAAVSCGYPIGTPRNSLFRLAIADTGTFIDPRTRKDWWKSPPPGWINTRSCGARIGFVDIQQTKQCTVVVKPPDTKAKIPITSTVDFLAEGFKEITQKFFNGTIAPKDNTMKVPDYQLPGKQLEKTTARFVHPAILKQMKYVEKDFTFSANTILCHMQAETNKFTIPTGSVFRAVALGVKELVNHAPSFNATLGQGKQQKTDMDIAKTHPDEIVTDSNPLPCGEPDTGDPVPEISRATQGQQTAQGSTEYKAHTLIPNVDELLARIVQLISAKACTGDACKITAKPDTYIQIGTKTPHVQELMEITGKSPSGQETGFTSTFKPATIDLNKRVGTTEDNEFEQTVSDDGQPVKGDLTFEGAGGMDEHFRLMQCGRFNAVQQQALGLDCKFTGESNTSEPLTPNTSDWAIRGDTTPINKDFSIPLDTTDVGKAITAATKGQIPRCVLEAVKYIETGKDWNPSTQCKINRCSAAGPFQITTGYVPYPMSQNVYQTAPGTAGTQLVTDCRQCSPAFERRYQAYLKDPKNNPKPQCPNAWAGDWPNTPTDSNPCSIADASKQAVQILQNKAQYFARTTLRDADPKAQKQAIILAGDSYYGSSVKIPRLDGCSYGEFVYRHCDPSYRCGSSGIKLP